ncbi:hypothetical protein CHS0354_030543 [Potamilus streckersoni]|uniref:G-protein coupled receptors family 1 profile domain-containing protein n=1 Tax=Potamilus streckersoni TaxID=2493646 RepID=A0AAE0VGC2_9BIVA|nr:hypothetical protein CHS0354_030543 [Potamilus streckersoni]
MLYFMVRGKGRKWMRHSDKESAYVLEGKNTNCTKDMPDPQDTNITLTIAYLCPNETHPERADNFFATAQFVTGVIIYPILCFPGIVGNILTLIVLYHKDMATSTSVYLSALALSDLIKLLNDLMYFIVILIVRIDPVKGEITMSELYPYTHYIFNVAVCITAWLTVSIAVERYISVCHPAKAKDLCTIPRARAVSVSVFVVMTILTIPSALRYEAVKIHDSLTNRSCFEIRPSDFGRNQSFMVPYIWIQNSLRSIVPLVVLIFLNARIINEVKRERVKGKSLSGKTRITIMLVIVIIVFLVCITPDAVMSMFFGFGYIEETSDIKGIREITDSLLALNSAFNFVLYCSMSQQFRGTFYKIFCAKCQDLKRQKRNTGIENGRPCVVKVIINNNQQRGLQETYV